MFKKIKKCIKSYFQNTFASITEHFPILATKVRYNITEYFLVSHANAYDHEYREEYDSKETAPSVKLGKSFK